MNSYVWARRPARFALTCCIDFQILTRCAFNLVRFANSPLGTCFLIHPNYLFIYFYSICVILYRSTRLHCLHVAPNVWPTEFAQIRLTFANMKKRQSLFVFRSYGWPKQHDVVEDCVKCIHVVNWTRVRHMNSHMYKSNITAKIANYWPCRAPARTTARKSFLPCLRAFLIDSSSFSTTFVSVSIVYIFIVFLQNAQSKMRKTQPK